MTTLSHINEDGDAEMVDVTDKQSSERIAEAEVTVVMLATTLDLALTGGLEKGDVTAVARVAGIQAAKKTSELIPLCHPLALTKVAVNFERQGPTELRIRTLAKVRGPTGVEMEALTAASVAALTIYDMCKAVERGIEITDLRLLSKAGGKSGSWQRK